MFPKDKNKVEFENNEGCNKLVPLELIEQLKDFDTWKAWKNNDITIKELNNKNFE